MFIFVIISLFITSIFAAFEQIPRSPIQIASGYSSFLEEGSTIGFVNHPATLSKINDISANIYYSSPYQLAGLKHYGAYFSYPLKFVNTGMGFSSFGNKLYNESTVSIAAARVVGNYMNLGLVINVRELTIKNYGNVRSLGISVSMDYKLSEAFRWALIYHNLNAPKIGTSDELLPQVVITGISFTPSANISTVMEVEKDLEFESRYKFGILWQPFSRISIASGFVNHPAQATWGFKLTFKNQQFSYAIASHPTLSITQVFALKFTIN